MDRWGIAGFALLVIAAVGWGIYKIGARVGGWIDLLITTHAKHVQAVDESLQLLASTRGAILDMFGDLRRRLNRIDRSLVALRRAQMPDDPGRGPDPKTGPRTDATRP